MSSDVIGYLWKILHLFAMSQASAPHIFALKYSYSALLCFLVFYYCVSLSSPAIVINKTTLNVLIQPSHLSMPCNCLGLAWPEGACVGLLLQQRQGIGIHSCCQTV